MSDNLKLFGKPLIVNGILLGKLNSFHIIETSIWLFIALIFFIFSFEFNQNIEIYIFGATGWPRAVLVLLTLASLGNLYHLWRNGDAIQPGRVGFSSDDNEEEVANRDFISYLKLFCILISPFLYAYSLKPIGFYSASPIFILIIILILGERRWRWIIGVTAFIYTLLLLLFVGFLNAPLPQGYISPFYDFSANILSLNTQLQNMKSW